jgi:hypothetical protein
MSSCCIVVVVGLSLVCAPSLACGAVTAWTDVVVRVYDTSGVMAGTNQVALDLARKTLEAASIDVIWRMCSAEAAFDSAQARKASALRVETRCDTPMARGELAIRIVRSPVPVRYRGSLPLGDAMLDTRTGSGVLATIYFDRVQWLARESGTDSRALLGRAIAHELGHLLLASTAHGPVGLMRALWSEEEVRRGRARDWLFAPGELATIRRRAEARRLDSSLAWGTR